MSIQELGSVGEFLSSIAVLVSVVYLAVQIRHGTEAARTSTYLSIVANFGALNRAMASTPDLSLLYVNAMENFDSLQADEKARVSQLNFAVFHYFENMYYQHQKGYLEQEVWQGWKRLMLTYHSRVGFQSWWAMRSDVFSKSFVDFLRTEELDKPVASYFDVTQSLPR